MRFGQFQRRVFFDGDNDGVGGGTGGDGDGKSQEFNYEMWLKTQPDDVKAALAKRDDESVKGLKTALDAERKENSASKKAKAELEKAQKALEEKALEEQKKFQELADARKAKLDELEPQVATVAQERDALKTQSEEQAAVLKEFLDSEVKALNLDDATKELLTGKSTVESLRWIAKHRETLSKGRANGAPSTPKPDGNGKLTDEERRKQAARIW